MVRIHRAKAQMLAPPWRAISTRPIGIPLPNNSLEPTQTAGENRDYIWL